MYSYRKLPASNQLDGIMDMFNMRSYWNALKGKIAEIQGLGLKISTYQQRIAVAQQTLLKRGNTSGAAALGDELLKIQDDLDKWWKVKGYIDSYLPQWVKLDEGAVTSPTSGVGMVPFVLAGMALVALAYCVNVGMALLQDYQFKSQLTQAVIDQKLSTGQMADILSIPKSEGVFEKVIGTVGVGVGIGIPTVLLVGGGLYLLFATGILRSILGSFGGGSSSQSSGA
jgi:hypothetical protein